MTPQRLFLSLSTAVLVLVLTLSTNIRMMSAQTATPGTSVDMLKLSDVIDKYLQSQGFVPGTTRQGSVYLYDLRNDQAFTVNPNVTYSGVSMTKIAVLVAFYTALHLTDTKILLTPDQARLLVKMIICSDNAAANQLLKQIGDGDLTLGLGRTEGLINEMGIRFVLKRPYSGDGTPSVTDGPVDSGSADVDPNNQIQPEELGKLLAFIYNCAQNMDDPFSNSNYITPNDCRHMIALMRAVHLGALIEAGVPNNALVAHKQGWSDDTHGDAALIMTPGGDYVLVITMHQRKWLASTGSFPVMSEVSRLVYNAYNPKNPLKAIHPQKIPVECPIELDVLNGLQTLLAPPIH